jgi:hypothetical protein
MKRTKVHDVLENGYYGNEVTLWIIRWQNLLSKLLHSKLLASVFMFYIPIMVTGYILQENYDYKIFSNGIIIALLWIAIAPFVIQNALQHVITFFYTHKHVFQNQEEWGTLYRNEIKRIKSSRYLVFCLPWGIITSLVFLCCAFTEAPLLIQFWVTGSFFILFFVSSIGFYGVYVLITMIQNICTADIIFNPFHPDKFGGISDFGDFAVRIALYFSSGALVLPLVYEVVENIAIEYNSLSIVIYFFAGFFIVVMLAAFFVPILEIKKLADYAKERIMVESRNKLDKMTADFKKSDDFNLKQFIEKLLYYHLNHSKLSELKNYPWDFRVWLSSVHHFLYQYVWHSCKHF